MNNQPIYNNQDAAAIRKRLDAYADSPYFTAGLQTAAEWIGWQLEQDMVKALLVGMFGAEAE